MHIHLAYVRLPRHLARAWDHSERDTVVRTALCAGGVLAVMPLEDGEGARGLVTIWADGETAADWRASRACTRLRTAWAELAGGSEAGEERRFWTAAAQELDQAWGKAR